MINPPTRTVREGAQTATVEVVVPSYNHARFVERCLRSIFDQTLAPARLLVIDDGSTDDSPRVVERVLMDCPFPSELVVRPNRGLCATLNEGLARTRGDFFAYIGSDDRWHPDRLRWGVRALSTRPECVLAYTDCFVIDGSDRVVGNTQQWAHYRDGHILGLLLRGESVPLNPTVLYRREILADVGWNESSRLEDYETYLRLAARGPFAYVPTPLAFYRQHGGNASGNIDMMLHEMLGAQRRVAPLLGLEECALRELEKAALFRHGGYYLAAGQRSKALRLTLANLSGAPSPAAALRRMVTLATPSAVLRWRRDRLARRAGERYLSAG